MKYNFLEVLQLENNLSNSIKKGNKFTANPY